MGFFPGNDIQSSKAVTDTPKCGGACLLNKGCKRPYQTPYGSGELKVLFVGSTPSKEEDTTGKKMTGDPGKLLRKISTKAGIPVSESTKTNAVRCYTPHEVDPKEVDCCRVFLNQLINEIQPEIIIPMGTTAIQSVIAPEWMGATGSFAQWVGYQIPSQKYNAWICPTYHPAWVLERGDDICVKIFQKHLKDASKRIGTRPDNKWDPRKEVKILHDPAEIVDHLVRYRKLGGTIAFDYETTGLKPDNPEMEIISNSVCWNGQETIAYMMQDDSVISETKRLLRAKSLGKIASNMKFEERWSREKLGVSVVNWIHDTMLSSHVLDNRQGICSIKFQAYIRYGINDYSSHISPFLKSEESNTLNRIKEVDQNDLLLYNGLDSLLEFKVAVDQMREQGHPWAGSQVHREKKVRDR